MPKKAVNTLSNPPPVSDNTVVTASSISPSPRSPSPKSRAPLLKRVRDRIHLAYYRYEVTFGMYTMTSGEKLVAHGIVIIVLALLVCGVFLYFPSVVFQKLGRLLWLLTGRAEGLWSEATEAISNPSATVAAVAAVAGAANPMRPDL